MCANASCSLIFESDHHFEIIAFLAGLVQTGLYADFFYSTSHPSPIALRLTGPSLLHQGYAGPKVRAPGVMLDASRCWSTICMQ